IRHQHRDVPRPARLLREDRPRQAHGERTGSHGEDVTPSHFNDLDRASDRHAATCRFSTAAILPQPSILRNLICPLAMRLKSRTSAASSLGSEPCVLTRRRNSSWSRSIVLVVRSVFHCALGKVKNVRSSSPPSRRLVTTPGHRLL